jgi:hypothetical protein
MAAQQPLRLLRLLPMELSRAMLEVLLLDQPSPSGLGVALAQAQSQCGTEIPTTM